MDDAGHVAAQREYDVEPEMQTNTDLKKHAKRRQQDGQQDTNEIHSYVGSNNSPAW